MSDILIVNNEQDVLEMLNEMVTRMGHRPESASTLKEARKKMFSHYYDVIFQDVRLTDVNGIDLLPLIKEMVSTPEVIIITGHADSDSAELAMKNGVWDFIQKPCSLSPMRLVLTRALKYREKKVLQSSHRFL